MSTRINTKQRDGYIRSQQTLLGPKRDSITVKSSKSACKASPVIKNKLEELTSKSASKKAGSGLARKVGSISKKTLESRYLNTYKALNLGGKETLESGMVRSVIAFCPTHSEEEMTQRFSKYNTVTQYLSYSSNEHLSFLLTTAKPLGSGTGGEVLSIEVEGVPVFVKKIRLTAIEQQHPKSTENLFELPPYYQYGVGSMGFGAWREIAAHEMTTQWVLNGECQNFPLMYHSRVLERSTPPKASSQQELEERQGYVDYWDGSSAVGKRAEAADASSAHVVVFMENIPQTLHKWLSTEGSKVNLPEVERELNLVTAFMKSRGFVHFDAHSRNILAGNNHAYFADFGLATSRKFDLLPQERAFLEKHIDYDRYYVVTEFAQSVIAATQGDEVVEAALDTYFSAEKMTITLPPAVESIAQRYRPIAVLWKTFFHGLREQSKSTPYPEAALAREWTVLKKTS